jgi:uncharacterized protein
MRILIFAIFAFSLNAVKAQFADSFPPQQWITDPDSFLSVDENIATTQLIKDLYTADSTGIFLLLLDTIPEDIAPFTQKLFRQWDLNNAGQKRTVLFIYTYGSRGLRIEASDAIVGILGRQYLKDVLTYTVIPKLRQRKDFEGIYEGLEMISKKLQNN